MLAGLTERQKNNLMKSAPSVPSNSLYTTEVLRRSQKSLTNYPLAFKKIGAIRIDYEQKMPDFYCGHDYYIYESVAARLCDN